MSALRFAGGPRPEDRDRAAEELAWAPTAYGELSLRRQSGSHGRPAEHEITLNNVCLSSSKFAVGGVELVRRALAELVGDRWDVAVGGLGLGFTACAVLDDRRVATLLVVDTIRDIAEWARAGLLPDGPRVTADRRTRLVVDDLLNALGPDPAQPESRGPRFDAVIIDVVHLSNPPLGVGHLDFWTPESLRPVADMLRSGGVFAVWSDTPPDIGRLRLLRSLFGDVVARPLAFEDSVQGLLGVHTMYVARVADRSSATPPARRH
ncbi:MAG TPA: hypothetical protein VGJ14_12765 [Sporichthyaceae bacterium]